MRYKAKTTRKAFEIRLGKEFSKVERAETYKERFGQWKKLTLYYAEDNPSQSCMSASSGILKSKGFIEYTRHVATWMSGEGWIF